MNLAVLSVLGVVLDAIFGEPKRWHPLVAFGALADRLERRFNRARDDDSPSPAHIPGLGWRSHGVTAWAIAESTHGPIRQARREINWWTARPKSRTVFGFPQQHTQPALRLADGTQVSLY